jgi:hypothetical protein
MIAILTQQQKDILIGRQFEIDSYFNPIQDLNNNWIISEIEYYYCLGLWYLDELNVDLQFIKDLSLTEYLPKPSELML